VLAAKYSTRLGWAIRKTLENQCGRGVGTSNKMSVPFSKLRLNCKFSTHSQPSFFHSAQAESRSQSGIHVIFNHKADAIVGNAHLAAGLLFFNVHIDASRARIPCGIR
jgi:hypothetical protein